jgi:hypothetical protein
MLYVSPDGNYGDADGLVQVDNESFDEHFYGYLDGLSDWMRPDYAVWFSENDHDFEKMAYSEYDCEVCEEWITQMKFRYAY